MWNRWVSSLGVRQTWTQPVSGSSRKTQRPEYIPVKRHVFAWEKKLFIMLNYWLKKCKVLLVLAKASVTFTVAQKYLSVKGIVFTVNRIFLLGRLDLTTWAISGSRISETWSLFNFCRFRWQPSGMHSEHTIKNAQAQNINLLMTFNQCVIWRAYPLADAND